MMEHRVRKLLNDRKTYLFLVVLNIATGAGTFLLFYQSPGKDALTYLNLADGILSGSYSFWNFLEHPMPDTLRNPGYPLFLAFFRLFGNSVLPIQLTQLLLYFLSVRMALSILDMCYQNIVIKNLFLLFLAPGIYVAAYAPVIFPEIPVTFLLILIVWLDLKLEKETWQKYLLMGLVFGITFQVRPAIMFLPFIYSVYRFYVNRANFSLLKNLAMLLIFFMIMIPYGLWNKKTHGTFKVTSYEGGAGLIHLGYWAFKLPDYYDTRYWGNYCNREIIPFIDESEKPENIARYNAEWDIIDSICAPLLTAHDSAMQEFFDRNVMPNLLRTFNGPYTLKREELLKEFAIKNIRNDFGFYLKVKIYSAIRLWVTGLRMKDFNAASPAKKAYLLYPLFITLITFIGMITMLPLAWYRYREKMKPLLWSLILALYIGAIHVPFTIQSRYTIPVRLEVLMLLAVAAYLLFFSERKPGQQKN